MVQLKLGFIGTLTTGFNGMLDTLRFNWKVPLPAEALSAPATSPATAKTAASRMAD
jgi:hypothetical protein